VPFRNIFPRQNEDPSGVQLMQQRQPRLGDILDDYCPRERRLTNHVVVAMVDDTVKQTRCTTCESDHEYKHAAVPRPRKKPEQTALYSQVLAAATPKVVATPVHTDPEPPQHVQPIAAIADETPRAHMPSAADVHALFDLPDDAAADMNQDEPVEEGPAHRRLIRAQLPRHEGQVSTARQAPDFTIRQPATGRPKRFGARPQRGMQFQGNRQGNIGGNGNGNVRNGGRPGGRPQGGAPRAGNRSGGRNRSK
jgi:hypothetical protein